MDFLTIKPGARAFAAAECARLGIGSEGKGAGLLAVTPPAAGYPSQMCFPSWRLENAEALSGETAADWFCRAVRGEKIEAPWPVQWLSPSDNGFAMNTGKAGRLLDAMRRKISRIVKLADVKNSAAGPLPQGLFVLESPEHGLFVSRQAFFFGQRRMKDNPAAPSRSFLKIEEAFSVMGRCPCEGETVADLGAAPGGWSWAAAKRGAVVTAIDNGPMKKGAADHPLIRHLQADAFGWAPPRPVDWLFCDVVDDPARVQERINTWFYRKWCRFAVVNFKYGRTDPGRLLEGLQGSQGLAPLAYRAVFRHLYHDRDEFTLMAEIRGTAD